MLILKKYFNFIPHEPNFHHRFAVSNNEYDWNFLLDFGLLIVSDARCDSNVFSVWSIETWSSIYVHDNRLLWTGTSNSGGISKKTQIRTHWTLNQQTDAPPMLLIDCSKTIIGKNSINVTSSKISSTYEGIVKFSSISIISMH